MKSKQNFLVLYLYDYFIFKRLMIEKGQSISITFDNQKQNLERDIFNTVENYRFITKTLYSLIMFFNRIIDMFFFFFFQLILVH